MEEVLFLCVLQDAATRTSIINSALLIRLLVSATYTLISQEERTDV